MTEIYQPTPSVLISRRLAVGLGALSTSGGQIGLLDEAELKRVIGVIKDNAAAPARTAGPVRFTESRQNNVAQIGPFWFEAAEIIDDPEQYPSSFADKYPQATLYCYTDIIDPDATPTTYPVLSLTRSGLVYPPGPRLQPADHAEYAGFSRLLAGVEGTSV